MPTDTLADEYPGDDAWKQFAHSVGATDEQIASVANAIMGSEATRWLETQMPALGGKSPREVLVHSPHGTDVIRALIMRVP
jgi:uncharacterized protein (DUF2384 family)